jgi:hypothetical protein
MDTQLKQSEIPEQVQVRRTIDVLVYGGKTLDEIKQTIQSLELQRVKPTNVKLVIYDNEIDAKDIINYLDNAAMSFKLSMYKMVDSGACYQWAIDQAVEKCKSFNVLLLSAGTILDEHYLLDIDDFLKRDEPYAVIVGGENNESNRLLIIKSLYQKVGGECGILHRMVLGDSENDDRTEEIWGTVLEKIKRLAEIEGTTNMIKYIWTIHGFGGNF